MNAHPHGGGRLAAAGPRPEEARLTVVLVHGRGGDPEDMLGLAGELGQPDAAFLAPEARGNSWYPLSFMAPTEANEPSLSSALRPARRDRRRSRKPRVPAEKVVWLGFPRAPAWRPSSSPAAGGAGGGLVAFSGGAIGPPGRGFDVEAEAAGSLDGTPAFLGCSDRDPHIPLRRVQESAAFLRRLGAAVDERIYPGMPHTVNADEIAAARALLARVGRPAAA